MKSFLFLVCALVVSATSASARSPIRYENFLLFSEPFHVQNPSCDRAVRMQIDYFERTAKLENVVLGSCEIAVRPDHRVYRLEQAVQNGCGSWLSEGLTVQTESPFFKIAIVDNRQRRCKDLRARLEVVERGHNTERQVLHLYSGR